MELIFACISVYLLFAELVLYTNGSLKTSIFVSYLNHEDDIPIMWVHCYCDVCGIKHSVLFTYKATLHCLVDANNDYSTRLNITIEDKICADISLDYKNVHGHIEHGMSSLGKKQASLQRSSCFFFHYLCSHGDYSLVLLFVTRGRICRFWSVNDQKQQ